jgi:hypothetical protein
MSYDLVLRSDAQRSRTVSSEALVALVSALPQVQPNGRSWVLSDGPLGQPSRLWMEIRWTAQEKETVGQITLNISYGFLSEETAGEYLAIARQLAELLGGWEIFDEQTGRVVGEGESLAGGIPKVTHPYNRKAVRIPDKR